MDRLPARASHPRRTRRDASSPQHARPRGRSRGRRRFTQSTRSLSRASPANGRSLRRSSRVFSGPRRRPPLLRRSPRSPQPSRLDLLQRNPRRFLPREKPGPLSATADQILNVLASVTETDEVRTQPDMALYDLQVLDSMKTVELIVALGREVGVEVSPAEFDRDAWATPRKLIADAQRRLAAA